MPTSLRFPIALVLSIVCLAVPAWADFQAGMDAYNRHDYPTALREWRPLAEQGVAEAQYKFGMLYSMGNGVPLDLVQARQWWEKAAVQRHVSAQYYLGIMYSMGYGVPRDFVQAHKWYSLAGANGDKGAATLRDALAKQMTPAQIAKAQRLAREWRSIEK